MNNKTFNILLWIVQALLAAMFVMSGVTKTIQPIEEIVKVLPWAASVPDALLRFIGITELLGGIGLILPSLLRIKPNLTPLAAMGLTIIMVLAAIFHVARGEYYDIGMNIVPGLLSFFVAWGRNKKVPILPKS